MMAGCFASQITFHWFIAYFITTTALQYDEWIEASSPLLPRGAAGCAIGYNPSNNTIWILGGDMDLLDYRYQLISFNYINTVFTDHGTGIPLPIWGFSQNYVQIGTTLFMADSSGSSINTFNMETIVFKPHNISTDLSFDWDESCITDIRTEYIAVLGKDGNVQILNMDSDVWLDSVPSLNVARGGASCIYINDKMFIIGGYADEYVDQSSIEYLSVSTASINNIASMLWTYTVDSLPFALSESRCVKVNDDILVIGGRRWDVNIGTGLNTVYVIDSISESVSLGGYLSKAVWNPAVVFINNMLYCFGGDTDNGWWDGWQTKAVTSTVSTTSEPTNNVISTSFSRASTTFDTHTTTVPMFGSSRQTNIGSTNGTDSAGHTTTVPIFRTKTQTSIGPTVNPNITFYPSVFTSGDTTTISIFETMTQTDVGSTNPIQSTGDTSTVSIFKTTAHTSAIQNKARDDSHKVAIWIVLVSCGVIFVCALTICVVYMVLKRKKKNRHEIVVRIVSNSPNIIQLQNNVQPISIPDFKADMNAIDEEINSEQRVPNNEIIRAEGEKNHEGASVENNTTQNDNDMEGGRVARGAMIHDQGLDEMSDSEKLYEVYETVLELTLYLPDSDSDISEPCNNTEIHTTPYETVKE